MPPSRRDPAEIRRLHLAARYEERLVHAGTVGRLGARIGLAVLDRPRGAGPQPPGAPAQARPSDPPVALSPTLPSVGATPPAPPAPVIGPSVAATPPAPPASGIGVAASTAHVVAPPAAAVAVPAPDRSGVPDPVVDLTTVTRPAGPGRVLPSDEALDAAWQVWMTGHEGTGAQLARLDADLDRPRRLGRRHLARSTD